MKAEITAFMEQTWAYLEEQAEEYLAGLPTWLAADIANFGLDVALDLTIQWTKPFTAQYFIDEIQGSVGVRASFLGLLFNTGKLLGFAWLIDLARWRHNCFSESVRCSCDALVKRRSGSHPICVVLCCCVRVREGACACVLCCVAACCCVQVWRTAAGCRLTC